MFKKDASQPGGGVFVAAERPSGDYSDLPTGTIVLKGAGGAGGACACVRACERRVLTRGGRAVPNVNPALNVNGALGPQHVQVVNVLDEGAHANLEQFAVTDNGLLEGIPGSMFDFPQWEMFFARFALPAAPAAGGTA